MLLRKFSEKLERLLWLQAVSTAFKVNCAVNAVGISDNSNVDLSDSAEIQPDSADERSEIISIFTNSSRDLFPWDKRLPANLFAAVFCSRMCNGSRLIKTVVCQALACFPCSCRRSVCQKYGSCCPDYSDFFPELSTSPATTSNYSLDTDQHFLAANRSATTRSDYTLDEGSNRRLLCDTYLYIGSCPSSYLDGQVRARCEPDVQVGNQDLATFLRVTDSLTGLTYFNKYCATCNGVTDFVYWKLQVNCHNYMKVYRASNPDELFRLSTAPESACGVTQVHPDNVSVAHCQRSWFETPAVDVCNVTGQWDIYDEDIERACAETSGVVNRVRLISSPLVIYKNIFCALCNVEIDKNINCLLTVEVPPPESPKLLPFSMLLNFGFGDSTQDTGPNVANCSKDTEWASPDNLCLPLQCSSGKLLSNGNCFTALYDIRGLLYKIQVVYLLLSPATGHRKLGPAALDDSCRSPIYYLRQFENQVKVIISDIAREVDFNASMIYRATPGLHDQADLTNISAEDNETSPTNCSHQFQINRFTLDGFLLSNRTFSRDQVELFLVDHLITRSVHLGMDGTKSWTLVPLLDPLRQSVYLDCDVAQGENSTCVQEVLVVPDDELYVPNLIKDPQDVLLLEPQLTCPFVSFNPTQFMYNSGSSSSSGGSSIVLSIGGAFILISEIHELNLLSIVDDGTLKVCKELLDKKSFPVSYRRNSLIVISQYILTLVCLSASILGLSVTLMTYSLFPVLRSVAGKNNMFLCGSLLLAQSSLLATSHVQPNSPLCTFFAISTHFLWLSMFCWCFTSCLHMFLTFSAKTRSVQTTASSERKYIIKRAVACSVVPALIVITVVVVNYFTSQGRLIGYGQTTCFLDSPTLIGTTMVTPLCIVLICNIYFFSVTIYKINNIRKLQSGNFGKEDRNDFIVYVKLSSVTGMFWIVSILSEATNNDPLRFIAISLNGLQGVFIFMSYICNKRVLRLYQRALGLEKAASTETSGMSSITTVVTDTSNISLAETPVGTVESE